MTTILEWAINISSKALALALAWILIRFVMKVGKTTFKDFLETAALDIKARGIVFRRRVLKRYEALEQTATPEENEQGCKVEATIR